MTRETLDETLDRVAREITAGPRDAAFVERLRPRLDTRAPHQLGLRGAVVVASLLALAVAAALWPQRGPAIHRVGTVARSSQEGPAARGGEVARLEPGPGESPIPGTGTAAAASRPPADASTHIAIEHTVTPSAFPALAEPPVLDVAHLQLDPLVVDAVGVSSLEIADLSVSDLGAAEDRKE